MLYLFSRRCGDLLVFCNDFDIYYGISSFLRSWDKRKISWRLVNWFHEMFFNWYLIIIQLLIFFSFQKYKITLGIRPWKMRTLYWTTTALQNISKKLLMPKKILLQDDNSFRIKNAFKYENTPNSDTYDMYFHFQIVSVKIELLLVFPQSRRVQLQTTFSNFAPL